MLYFGPFRENNCFQMYLQCQIPRPNVAKFCEIFHFVFSGIFRFAFREIYRFEFRKIFRYHKKNSFSARAHIYLHTYKHFRYEKGLKRMIFEGK